MHPALMLLSGLAAAQHGPELELTPHLEVRARGLFDHVDGIANGFADQNIILERSRIGLDLSRGNVEARAGVQQHRALNPNPSGDGYVLVRPTVAFYESWGRIIFDLPAEVGLNLTVGRQLITLHEGRLIGEYDFSFDSKPLDAFQARFEAGRFHMTLLNYRDFEDPASLENPGTSVFVAGLAQQTPSVEAVFDLITIGDFSGGENRGTFGIFAKRAVRRIDAGAEIYGQASVDEATGDAVEAAVLFSAWAGITVGPERLLHVGAQYDVLSQNIYADDDPTTDLERPGGFRPVSPDAYAFNGHMNLFVSPEDTNFRGLQDLSLQAHFRATYRFGLDVDYHAFWFAESPAFIGGEYDLSVTYYVAPMARAQLGLFSFMPGASASELSSDDIAGSTAYIQLVVGI